MPTKLTPWFMAAFIKPARSGVYQRLTPSGAVMFSRWDGRRWCANHHKCEGAARIRRESLFQKSPWRGVASDPKAV